MDKEPRHFTKLPLHHRAWIADNKSIRFLAFHQGNLIQREGSDGLKTNFGTLQVKPSSFWSQKLFKIIPVLAFPYSTALYHLRESFSMSSFVVPLSVTSCY